MSEIDLRQLWFTYMLVYALLKTKNEYKNLTK